MVENGKNGEMVFSVSSFVRMVLSRSILSSEIGCLVISTRCAVRGLMATN